MSKKIGCGGFRIDDDTLKLKEDGTLYAAGGGGVQPDWNQNDSAATDYIKNRPFYTGDPSETVLVEESTVSFSEYGGMLYSAQIQSNFEATVGQTYKVTWDGAVYECACVNFNNMPFIGNLSIAFGGSDTGEPFLMGINNGSGIGIYTKDTSASHTISISGSIAEVTQIPDKYISDTFRDVVIAGNPQLWSEDDWAKYYGLFQNGKLLMINGYSGFDSEGYVLSMFYSSSVCNMSVVSSTGGFYKLSTNSDSEEDKFYWAPIINLGAFYFQYDETGSNASEAYKRLEISDGLTFTTKNANEDAVMRKVVLEGDKEIILSSSTSGSTKKFKITVDDSGTIKATAVT